MPVKPLGQRSPLRMRYGMNVPMALGMEARGDEGFDHIENAVFSGPSVKSRPGQQRATDQVTGPIEGMCDVSDIGAAVREVNLELGLAVIGDNNAPRDLLILNDSEGAYEFAALADVDAVGSLKGGAIRTASNKFYLVTVESANAKLRQYKGRSGTTTIVASIASTETPHWCEAVGASTLWIPTKAGSDVKVYSWDGTTVVLDHTVVAVSSSHPRILSLDPALMLLIESGASNNHLSAQGTPFYHRTGAGVWSIPGLPVGITFFNPRCSVNPFASKSWFGGTGDSVGGIAAFTGEILSWDGATLVRARNIAGATGTPIQHVVACMAIFDGNLYYLHFDQGTVTPNMKLGKYDGATWTDNYFDLAATFPGDSLNLASFMGVRDNRLFILAGSSTGGGAKILYRSGVNDPSAWTKLVTLSGSVPGVYMRPAVSLDGLDLT